MFIRAKIVKQIPYYCLVESERIKGEPRPRQRVLEYLGNYQAAIATLPTLDHISPADRQKFTARINELEADLAARGEGKPKGKRGRPRKTESGASTPTHLEAHHNQLQ